MDQLVEKLRAELKGNVDTKTQRSFQRFFKNEVQCYGVKTRTVRAIAKKYWKEVQKFDKKEIFDLCEELLRSDNCEEAFIVSSWIPNMSDRFEPSDLILFKTWIERYINNWAKCDSFCNHSIGDLVERFPECVNEVKRWATSANRWLRRAATVSLIVPAKRGEFLPEIFEITDQLLHDDDDMVQKGYGWLLKEASRKHQEKVFDYVVKNKNLMPRTALRYAIEFMPNELKVQAMRKE